MTRTISDKYMAWLCGYYDDFNGTYCVPDDKNNPDSLTIDHTLSHHGNTCNGDAPLNPTYRFSVIEREGARVGLSEDFPVATWMGDSAYTGLIHNEGLHDYITHDQIRLSYGSLWEGMATPRQPQSFFHQNRAKTGISGAGSSTDGYMRFTNPRRTGANYWTFHDNDGSHGRSDLKDYTSGLGGGSLSSSALDQLDVVSTQGLRREAYLTGSFQWQTMEEDAGDIDKRNCIGYPIESLSGNEFLVLDTKWRGDTTTNPLISLGTPLLMQYDGTLNSLGNKDVFHIRVARQTFFGGTLLTPVDPDDYEPRLKLCIGYDTTDTTIGETGPKDSGGSDATACVEVNLQWSDLNSIPFHYLTGGSPSGTTSTSPHSTKGAAYDLTNAAQGTELTNIWIDLDIEFDFTNQTYQLYVDGVKTGNPGAFETHPDSRPWVASDLKGWAIKCVPLDFTPVDTSNPYAWQQIIMIDRVCMMKNITHHIGNDETAGGNTIDTSNTDYPAGSGGGVSPSGNPMMQDLEVSFRTNGHLSASVNLTDDMDNLDIYPLINGGGKADFLFLVFREGGHRPVLTTIVDSVSVKQNNKQQTKDISLSLSDPAKLLDRNLPVWDLGQNAFLDDEDKAVGRRSQAEMLYDALYFGAVKLKLCDDKIGYIYNSTPANSYKELKEQRTKLHSSHPIQIYNNEDELGPNFPEYEWLNYRAKTVSAWRDQSTLAISTTKVIVHIDSHGLSNGDTVNVIGNSNYSISAGTVSDVLTNSFTLTHTPPSHNATTKRAHRIQFAAGGTGYTAFVLDAASYTSIPDDLENRHIAILNGGGSGQNIYVDNVPIRVYAVAEVSGTGEIMLLTDVEWTNIGGGTSPKALSNPSFPVDPISTHPWRIYWEDIWVDKESSSAAFNTGTGWDENKYRTQHSIWMRDITSSLWFKKQFGKISATPLYTGTISTNITSASTQILTSIGHTAAIEAVLDVGGVGEIVLADGRTDSFCFSSASNVGGYIRLNGIKFLSLSHTSGATINIRNISNDFKHTWVLWADMRNSGVANADGATRKNKFGLLYPTPDNYSVSLSYTDQETIDGLPVNFVDLSIGVDCDIWECNANKEPYSDNAWSTLYSNSYAHHSQFANWENKGGSFLILDFSKFFNLNTEANGGRCNQSSGGRQTLGDLVVETQGHPALIDDYWQEVCTTPANSYTPHSYHRNWYHFFSAGSNLAPNTGLNNIAIGDTDIVLDDTSEFPNEGIGMIEVERESSNSTTGKERNLLFFNWTGNNTGTNTLSGVSIYDLDETALTEKEIRRTMASVTFYHNSVSGSASGSPQVIRYNDEINNITDGYDKIVFYSGLSAPLALRFMMNLNGFVETENSNTYYINDSVRAITMLAAADYWLNKFTIPSTFSIKNIPITKRMTTTQTAVSSTTKSYDLTSGITQDWDSYGGSIDMRGKSVLQMLGEHAKSIRIGDNSQSTTFTMTSGRDGRMDIRPAYSSGYVFNRNNLSVSEISGSPTVSISNVRVFYNNGSSFVDYPSASLSDETRWKLVDLPNVRSNKEALEIAKATYEQNKESPLRIRAEFITQATETDKMLYNARFGYILDPAHRMVRTGYYFQGFGLSWTSWFNGIHYSGCQNALDGNLTYTGSTNAYNKDITGDPTKTTGGGISGYLDTGNLAPEEAYTWIGNKSISQAVQIVHIPKGMPKFSDSAFKDKLRITIFLADSYGAGSTVDDVEFYLALVDPATTFSTGTGSKITITDNYGSTSSIKFKHSGFHEIAIPSTYWSSQTGDERIIVSINAEYLRALLRHRNGNNAISTWKFANAHDVAGFNTTNGGTEVRAYSPFPLGMRISASIPAGQNAPIYQAPRISVVDDLNFYAGTKVDYTDASIGISSTTPFVVSEVRWSAHERQHDKITLVLEKDESKALSGLASYIIPEINKGRTPATTPAAPTPSPSRGGGGGSRGGGGYYPSPSPPFQGPIGTLPSVPSDIPIGVRQVNGSGPADAISGQMLQLNNVGVNNASEDLLKRIKGNMDLHTQFGMKDGDFSILGQKNPGQTPIQSMGVGGVGLVWDKRRNAVFTSEGAVFPGVSTNTDTDVGHTAIHSLTVGVPENVVGKKINVDATVNFDADTDEGAILKFTVQCLETNASSTIDVPIYYSMSNDSQRLITTEIEGAQTPGNTIKITIQRQVNTGNDDAKYSAVLLKNLDVKFIQSTFTGRSDSYRFLGFKNNGVRNL